MVERHFSELPKGIDIAPHGETVKVWSVGVSTYLLLEQGLKFLATMNTDLSDEEEDKRWKKYGHNLGLIFKELDDEYQEDLEQAYREYASFVGFAMERYPSLKDFLVGVAQQDQIMQFRYILIQERKLSPWAEDLYIEMLWEVTRNVISLCQNKESSYKISKRIKNLTARIACIYITEGDGITSEMIQKWLNREGGYINTVSRLIRIPELKFAEYERPFVDYIKRVYEEICRHSQAEKMDRDWSIFESKARVGCFLWDDANRRFRYYNERPAPLDVWASHTGDWMLQWHEDDVDRHIEMGFDWIDKIPIKDGQLCEIHTSNDASPRALQAIKLDGEGKLILYRNGKEIISFNAVHIGRSWSGTGIPDDDIAWERYPSSMTFKRGLISCEVCEDTTCSKCKGYGLCIKCNGEDEACRNKGLCDECRGYGKDGDYLLVTQDRYK